MKENTHITLRDVTINDLELLQYWDEQQHVIDSDSNDDWNWATELQRHPAWRRQLIAELDGRPIGFVQIIDPSLEETHYWGDVPPNLRAIDIWIGEASDLGKVYGTIMMRLAIDMCFANEQVTAILIDPLESNTKAIRFYERLGFEFSDRHLLSGNDECAVYILKREKYYKQ